MSKRLRSSFRPAKARSLRPRGPARDLVVETPLPTEPVVAVSAAEPVVAEPVVAEPVVAEPVVAEPPASEPATEPKPVVAHAAELVVVEPVAEPEPVSTEVVFEPASTDLAPESIPTKPSRTVRPKAAAEPPRAKLSLEDEDGSASSLSLSAEFFRDDEDSVPPFIDTVEMDEPVAAPPPSPRTIARRARFRRVVGAVVAVAGLVSLAVVGKTLATSRPASASAPPVHVQPPAKVAAAPVAPKPVEAAPPPKAEPAPVAEAKPEPSAEAKTETPEPAKSEPAAEAKADKPAETAAPSGDAVTLKKEALALMNRGKLRDAIPVAQAAIEADPSDALSYLYLGSALQDTGKWKDGIEAYSECVRHATKGPIHECRAMGGKK